MLLAALLTVSASASEPKWILHASPVRVTGDVVAAWYGDYKGFHRDATYSAFALSIGRRLGTSDFSWAVGTRLFECRWLALMHDPNMAIAPLYGHLLYTPEMPRPGSRLFYAFAGVTPWALGEANKGIELGIGLSATLWVITPGVELSWRRASTGPGHELALRLTAELGGWYSF